MEVKHIASMSSTTRYFVSGLPNHRKGNFAAYLREQKITFNRLHDHGSSAHVSVAVSDAAKFLDLKTFLGKPLTIEVAKPMTSTLKTDVAYLVLEGLDLAALEERGYSVKARVVAPKEESAKRYKLAAVKFGTTVKTRALADHKPLATAEWVSNVAEGSLIFAIPNLFAAGDVLRDFASEDVPFKIKRTDSATWAFASVTVAEEPETEDQPQDGGETEDEAEEPVPKKVVRNRK